MPIMRDPQLDRLIKQHDAAWDAKVIAEKKCNGFKMILTTIAQELRDTRRDYRAEVQELSDEIGWLQREANRNRRHGAPRVAKKKLAEASKLLERRNELVRERQVVRLLMRSTQEAAQRTEVARDAAQREWEFASAELEAFKQRRRLQPTLEALIADRAGVPVAHQNTALIKRKKGKYDIYFGGEGDGVGPGHGHFVFDPRHGRNIYTRMPQPRVGDN